MKVAVLGLARNCERTLPGILDSIESWGVDTRVIIGEDGSSDGTRSIVQSRAELVDTSPTDPAAPRLVRMARARERVKAAYDAGARADLVLVIDMDANFATSISTYWLQSSYRRLRQPGAPFALSATSTPYYDLLAFESDGASFSGLDKRIKAAQKKPLSYRSFKLEHIYAEQDRLTQPNDIRCISAFNGVAAYLDSTYYRSSYESIENEQVCEHVVFNRRLARDGARMIVDASLRVPTPLEHVRQSSLNFYASALRKVLGLK